MIYICDVPDQKSRVALGLARPSPGDAGYIKGLSLELPFLLYSSILINETTLPLPLSLNRLSQPTELSSISTFTTARGALVIIATQHSHSINILRVRIKV